MVRVVFCFSRHYLAKFFWEVLVPPHNTNLQNLESTLAYISATKSHAAVHVGIRGRTRCRAHTHTLHAAFTEKKKTRTRITRATVRSSSGPFDIHIHVPTSPSQVRIPEPWMHYDLRMRQLLQIAWSLFISFFFSFLSDSRFPVDHLLSVINGLSL